MAGTYTALGTAQSTTLGTTLVLSGVTVPAGAMLIVCVAGASIISSPTTVVFVAESLDLISGDSTAAMVGQAWGKVNMTGGTGSITATFSAAITKKVLSAFYVIGQDGTDAAEPNVISTGSSTTPDSTSDGLLPYMHGVVFTNGPVEDTAGSWTQSVTAGQRGGTTGGVATTNVTVSDCYKNPGLAYGSAGKTGITSRDWIAFGAGTGLVADLSTTLGLPTATGTAQAMTKAPGVATLALGLAVAVGSCEPITGSFPATTDYNNNTNQATQGETADTDPWTGNPFTMPQTAYTRSSSGAKLVSGAYLAYIQTLSYGFRTPGSSDYDAEGDDLRNHQGNGISRFLLNNSGPDCSIRLAIDGLPQIVSTSEDVNYLYVHEEMGGQILTGIGITPSGRVVFTTKGIPDVTTPINTITADHTFHTIECIYAFSQYRYIYLDGVQIVVNTTPVDGDDGSPIWATPGPDYAHQSRILLLNGPSGLTNINARISSIKPHVGILEYTLPVVPTATLTPSLATALTAAGLDLTLTLGYINPQVLTPYGPVPTVSPTSKAQGWGATPYVPRNPVSPGYTRVPS